MQGSVFDKRTNEELTAQETQLVRCLLKGPLCAARGVLAMRERSLSGRSTGCTVSGFGLRVGVLGFGRGFGLRGVPSAMRGLRSAA